MTFTPRLDDNGILNNFHWYSDNPFYQSGYGLPNCTCYAYGRFWEESDPLGTGANKPIELPLGDGGTWWGDAVQAGYYQTGQTPKLGAVACFYDNNGGAGHVAIVEEIDANNNITCSNSAWQSTYFYLTNLSSSSNYSYSHFTFQGFIYNPYLEPEPEPEIKKRKGFPWAVFTKNIRARRALQFN